MEFSILRHLKTTSPTNTMNVLGLVETMTASGALDNLVENRRLSMVKKFLTKLQRWGHVDYHLGYDYWITKSGKIALKQALAARKEETA